MAQRGRVPQGEYRNKSKVLSTRIKADTREALEAACAKSGRSLSQEIEHRLRRSLVDDTKIIESFGGRRNYAMMKLLASAIEAFADPRYDDGAWLDDPYLFGQAVDAVMTIMNSLRPPGSSTVPADIDAQQLDDKTAARFQFRGASEAHHAIVAAQQVHDTLPLSDELGLREAHRSLMIRKDLGEVIWRATPFLGTPEQLRDAAGAGQ